MPRKKQGHISWRKGGDRTISTNLHNILDLVACAEDYGYGKSIFYSAMFEIMWPLSDLEIEVYAKRFLHPDMVAQGYGQEDYEVNKDTLTELRERYQKREV